jgi:hypothetical protein
MVVMGLIGCLSLAAAFMLVLAGRAHDAQAAQFVRVKATLPTAAEFGRALAGTSNAYAAAHGEGARLTNVDCVQGSPGHYMCSYGVEKPGGELECHIMQGRWTPRAASSITVTLAGRTGRCESLRAALHSLP